MGVYVKGMEMPKNCHSCPMCLMRFCQAGDRELSEQETRPNAKRPEDCPLVPVPPHGRLIDASEMIIVQVYEDQYEDYRSVSMTIDDLLSGQGWIDADAPTIIEAEE